jgi:hypothetical protein
LIKSAIQKTLHELKYASVYDLQLRIPIEEVSLEDILEQVDRNLR